MWRWKRGRKEGSSSISRDSFAKWAGECVELVAEKTGVKLDYSLESLKTLDAAVSGLKPEEFQSELLGAYIVLTGSYLGEVIVRNLDGKWGKTGSPLGWAVKIGDMEIDVFQIAFESVSQPDRFSRLHSELDSKGEQAGVNPRVLSELEELIVKGYTSEIEKPEKREPLPWEALEEDYEY
ncbi:MAG: hypothetical protein FGF48_09705 [Candidatus Brockarchaeota archaeon]|nr:hypothetical protein [Candidatus Brockarchaeota archaeon]